MRVLLIILAFFSVGLKLVSPQKNTGNGNIGRMKERCFFGSGLTQLFILNTDARDAYPVPGTVLVSEDVDLNRTGMVWSLLALGSPRWPATSVLKSLMKLNKRKGESAVVGIPLKSLDNSTVVV